MSYATCRRCGTQLAEPKLGHRVECPSCHAVYSVKTPQQASDGAPHCAICGTELNDAELFAQNRRQGFRWICSACRHP